MRSRIAFNLARHKLMLAVGSLLEPGFPSQGGQLFQHGFRHSITRWNRSIIRFLWTVNQHLCIMGCPIIPAIFLILKPIHHLHRTEYRFFQKPGFQCTAVQFQQRQRIDRIIIELAVMGCFPAAIPEKQPALFIRQGFADKSLRF